MKRTGILVGQGEDEGFDVAPIPRLLLVQGKASLRLAEVDHIQRKGEICMVIDWIAAQELWRDYRRRSRRRRCRRCHSRRHWRPFCAS